MQRKRRRRRKLQANDTGSFSERFYAAQSKPLGNQAAAQYSHHLDTVWRSSSVLVFQETKACDRSPVQGLMSEGHETPATDLLGCARLPIPDPRHYARFHFQVQVRSLKAKNNYYFKGMVLHLKSAYLSPGLMLPSITLEHWKLGLLLCLAPGQCWSVWSFRNELPFSVRSTFSLILPIDIKTRLFQHVYPQNLVFWFLK